MYSSFDRFMIQLKSYRKMVKNTDSETNDKPYKITIETIVNIIIDRKMLENRQADNSYKFSEEENEFNLMIMEFSNKLIEANTIAKKLYEVIDVLEEDGKISLVSKSRGILNYVYSIYIKNNNSPKYRQDDLLFQSLSISLCSALENLSSEMLKDFYFNHHKGDLFENKEISYKSMKDFESIDDVRLYLIDKEIEGTFRRSFTDWIDSIDKVLNVFKNFPEAKHLSECICELYQRRNLYVHANGIVNKRYIEVVNLKYREQIEIGDRINITKDYLLAKISEVESLGWYMFYSYVMRYQEEDERFSRINDKLVDSLQSGNSAIPIIFKKMINNRDINQVQLYAKVNYFLFYHVNNRVHEIKEELINFDVSVLAVEYKMAKSILLDSEDKHDLVKKYFETVDDGDFLAYYDWPLIHSVKREEPSKTYFEDRLGEIFKISEENEIQDVDYKELSKVEINENLEEDEILEEDENSEESYVENEEVI